MNADPDGAPGPELAAVQQQEQLEPLTVAVEGTVRTYVLPARSGASRNYTVGSGEPVILLGQDLRRRRATILGSGGAYFIGSRDDCMNGSAAIWDPSLPLVIEHTERIYVRGVDTEVVISVIAENWAD